MHRLSNVVYIYMIFALCDPCGGSVCTAEAVGSAAQDVKEHATDAVLMNESSSDYFKSVRYCVYCVDGRRIYVNRENTEWQNFRASFVVAESVAKGVVMVGGSAVLGPAAAVYAGVKVASNAVKYVEKAKATYDVIFGEGGVSNDVARVSLEVYEPPANGSRPTKAEFEENLVYAHLDFEKMEIRDEDPLQLLRKDPDNLWMVQYDCWTWRSTYKTCLSYMTLMGEKNRAPEVLNILFDRHPSFCGGQGGMKDHTKHPKVLGVGSAFGSQTGEAEAHTCVSGMFYD